MKTYRNPGRETWSEVLKRPTRTYEEIEGLVASMFEEIRKDGDQGVRKYVKAFDGADLDALEVSDVEKKEASGKFVWLAKT